MAAIFNDIVIHYGGKTYTVKPTFALINKIEQPVLSGGLGISLAGLSTKASRGEVAITEVAKVLAMLLRSEGAEVEDEDMYSEMFSGDQKAIAEYVSVIMTAFFPVSKTAVEADKKK